MSCLVGIRPFSLDFDTRNFPAIGCKELFKEAHRRGKVITRACIEEIFITPI
jgi:hypothetical protein